jgi:hypothetical protein
MTFATLFDSPTRFEPTVLERWARLLTRHWMSLMGRPPADLTDDLNAMTLFFASGASAKTVKARVYDLPQLEVGAAGLPRSLVLPVGGSGLITPEGRILLDLLLELQRTGRFEIDLEQQRRAWATSSQLRSEWHARWLHKQFDSTVSAPVLGAVLFLVVNGSIGEHRALLMPGETERDRELGHVVMPLIAAFSKALGGKAPDTDIGVRQHWVFTQVTRLLGRDVAREKDGGGSLIWVRPERERHLVENLAHRLHKIADPARRYTAVHGLVDDYREVRGRLAALGQMHEDPTSTRRTTQQLLAADGLS